MEHSNHNSEFFSTIEATLNAKGLQGEWSVDYGISAAQRMGYTGRILHNSYVPKNNGAYTEIDVLYITRKGIFVFESKNFRGWIFGDGAATYWTLSVTPHTKHKFYNPILQNKGHIHHLSKYISGSIPFFSVIAYSQQCQIKKMSNVPPNTFMVHYNDIPLVMQRVWAEYPDVMSENQVLDLFNSLSQLRTTDLDVIHSHTQSVIKHANTPEPMLSHKCPCCGGNLVLRTAKKGINFGRQFWGCSNYPKCSYTRSL